MSYSEEFHNPTGSSSSSGFMIGASRGRAPLLFRSRQIDRRVSHLEIKSHVSWSRMEIKETYGEANYNLPSRRT